MALNSDYSQRQQSANSFRLALLSARMINISELDGSAIPYRFNTEINITYFSKLVKPVDYFNEFVLSEPVTEE